MEIRRKRSLETNQPKNFIVNHPFIFYIITKNGSYVFVGRIIKLKSIESSFIKEEL